MIQYRGSCCCIDRREIDVEVVTDFIFSQIQCNPGGGTIDPLGSCKPSFAEDDWCVSQVKNERELDHVPSRDEVREWVEDVASELELPGRFVGWWRVNRFYLDVTRICVGRSIAIGYGVSQNQYEIYQPYKQESVVLTKSSDGVDLQTVPIEASNGYIIGLCHCSWVVPHCVSNDVFQAKIGS